VINSCPKCGGSQIRQITPGYFECSSQVVKGVLQLPTGPMPAVGACGHHFQTGTISASFPPCGCGRDSIGNCAECARRLCGLHGTTSGPFLCRECLDARAQRKAAEANAAQAQAQAAAASEQAALESRQAALSTKLAAAHDVEEIVKLITANEAELTDAASKSAWVRLAGSGSIDPTSDIVTAVGKEHFLRVGNWCMADDPGWGWRETGRTSAWQWQNGTAEVGKRRGWLDAEGEIWMISNDALKAGSNKKNFVALPLGETFRTTSSPGAMGIIQYAGTHAPRKAASGFVVFQQGSDAGHAHAVASILRASRLS
jgi:hypothetical protein